MQIKVIICDLDGVVFTNSPERGRKNFKRALADCGIKNVSEGIIDMYWVGSVEDIVRRVLEAVGVKNRETERKVMSRWEYRDRYSKPYPKLIKISLLKKLNDRYFVTTLTGRRWEDLAFWFHKLGLKKYFGVVQTSDRLFHVTGSALIKRKIIRGRENRKPKAGAMKIHLAELRTLGFRKSHCVYLDDGIDNMLMIENGFPAFIAVAKKEGEKQSFLKSGVPKKRIIPSMLSLPKVLKELEKKNGGRR